jgi:hypothetical protein
MALGQKNVLGMFGSAASVCSHNHRQSLFQFAWFAKGADTVPIHRTDSQKCRRPFPSNTFIPDFLPVMSIKADPPTPVMNKQKVSA